VGPWVALILLAVPSFYVLDAARSAEVLVGATAILTFLHIFGSSAAILLFMLALPARSRAAALGIVYAVSIALFGGTTQIVEKLLIRWTGSPVAPAWYMVAAVLAGLIGSMLIRQPAADVGVSADTGNGHAGRRATNPEQEADRGGFGR
jgi:hypothetical protein